MTDFVVSARKYRPAIFDNVIGQNSITKTLKSAIIENRLAQSFLFCGPRGVGKTTCARILAKSINCENLSNNIEPCNNCESCNGFNQSNSFNIHEMDAASNNSVNDIRNLIDQVRFAPQVGKYNVYIIDEVHMLSAGAFNAFLKTLEEPPNHAKFILATTEKNKIIPTILSRCQIFDFKQISCEDIVKYLTFIIESEGIKAEHQALFIIAQKAEGSLRDALSIFDRIVSFSPENIELQHILDHLNILDSTYYFKIVDELIADNFSNLILIFNEILNNGFDGNDFINGLASHFRNLLMCQESETVNLLESTDEQREKYLTQSKDLDSNLILQALILCNECDLQYKVAKNQRLLVELCLIRMCSIGKDYNEKKNSKTFVDPQINRNKKDNKKLISQELSSPSVKTNASNTNLHKSSTSVINLTNQKTHKQSRTISITETLSEIDANNQQKQKHTPSKNVAFSQSQLEACWAELIIYIKELGKTNLTIAIEAVHPKLLKESLFEIQLHNAFQEELVREDKDLILNFLREKLKNDYLDLTTNVLTEVKNAIPHTNREKYKIMSKNNPNLESLSKHLGLDIDY